LENTRKEAEQQAVLNEKADKLKELGVTQPIQVKEGK
jgi:hypothetical protein